VVVDKDHVEKVSACCIYFFRLNDSCFPKFNGEKYCVKSKECNAVFPGEGFVFEPNHHEGDCGCEEEECVEFLGEAYRDGVDECDDSKEEEKFDDE